MHDRSVVVGANVVAVSDVLVEVVLEPRLDPVPVDRYEEIPVFAALLVPEADDVADLVDHVAGHTSRPQVDELLATPSANRR